MTTQTRYSIELADIVSIRLQCRNEDCSSSLLIDLHEETGNLSSLLATDHNVLTMCPGCGFPWMEQGQMTVDSEIRMFLHQMNELRKMQDKFGCSLTFEISQRTNREIHRST
jgi:DNA transposition AAA+ family ATPase